MPNDLDQNRVDGAAALKPVRLKIDSDPANLATIRKAVEGLALEGGFDGHACGEIALCVNEALANIMRHAYGGATDRPIEVEASMSDQTLHVRIRDWGNGVNPEMLSVPPRDPLKPGGLGLICLRKLMDELRFLPQVDGMLLEMSRKNRR
jgi:anti-sigma regulatory factor (Ser/Thr protein kinase)